MRFLFGWMLVLGLFVVPPPAPAGAPRHVTLAAAADLRFAMDQVVAAYRQKHPADRIDVVYGSSGKLLTQIEQGAPFDLFFSADSAYPQQLVAQGKAGGPPVPYAVGRIVLWSASLDMKSVKVADLAEPRFGRIAIANPQHAPYGKRAEQALRAAGIWEQLQPRLVYGENIGQAAQFAQSGNARVGIIAQSLALAPAMAGGSYVAVPPSMYQPLQQSFVPTRRGAANPMAREFAQFVQGAAARAILARYGFAVPAAADR